MAQNPQTKRLELRDSQWYSGCDSQAYPTDLQPGEYAWGVNVTNRGGIVQTRPRKMRVFSATGRRAQGMTTFRTFDGVLYMVWGIDGYLYYSQFPFKQASRVPTARFSPNVPRLYFAESLQAVEYNPDQSIRVLPDPINWLIVQDGISAPAHMSGTGVFQPPVTEATIAAGTTIPIGTSMITCGNRLWVAVDHKVYAGDLLNPLQFQENTYVAEQSAFRFPDPVTCLAQAPQNLGLIVQTVEDTFSLQANIQDRTLWQTTPLFQDIVAPGIGNVAPNSFVNQNGLPWWYSAKGWISLDAAAQTKVSAVMNIRDGEMSRSKVKLSPTITGICAGTFRSMLMVAVPAMSQFNRHTWVMDCAVASKLNIQTPPCWVGVWTGTYPVSFATVKHQGVEHSYEMAYSAGYRNDATVLTDIHIWENFIPIEKDDNTTPVHCQLEFKMMALQSEELFQATFIELVLANISGVVELDIFLAGSSGNYELLNSVTLRADIGPFGHETFTPIIYEDPGVGPNSELQSFRAQARWVRSNEALNNLSQTDPHTLEVGLSNCIDKAFQILLKWEGNMAVRSVKLYYRPVSEQIIGDLAVDETDKETVIFDS